MFSAFTYPNFRWFWLNTAFWSMGWWTELVVLGWLVLELTDSPLILGLVMACRGIPMLLLGAFGGLLADKLERRKLLVISQIGLALLALLMGILIAADVIQLWHVIVITLLAGTVRSLSLPARQIFLFDIVGRNNLLNGVAMNRIAQDSTRIIGPALGGGFIVLMGTDGAFYLMAISHILGAIVVFMIREVAKSPLGGRGSAWGNFIEGLKYVRSNHTVLSLLSIEIIVDIFAFSYYTMLPVFARDVLGVGAAGLGFLMSASGVGALLGSLAVVALGDFGHKGWLLLGNCFFLGVALVLFAISPWYPLSLVLLAFAGAAGSVYDTAEATALQIIASDEMRGRVLGAYVLTWGMAPLGSAQAGAIASLLGASFAVAIGGAIVVAYALIIAGRAPNVRRLS